MSTANIHKGILLIFCLSWSLVCTMSSLTYTLDGLDWKGRLVPIPIPLAGASSVSWRKHHFCFAILPPENRVFCFTEIEIYIRKTKLASFFYKQHNCLATNFPYHWISFGWLSNSSEDFSPELEILSNANKQQ